MFVFVCAGCGARLTTPLSQVTLPAHAHQKYGNGIRLPVLMESGTFAVDPEPRGPPWEETDPDEAAARGIYAPVHALSDGAPGAIVIAPGDTRGTLLIPEKALVSCFRFVSLRPPSGSCCGLPRLSGTPGCASDIWWSPTIIRCQRPPGADSSW